MELLLRMTRRTISQYIQDLTDIKATHGDMDLTMLFKDGDKEIEVTPNLAVLSYLGELVLHMCDPEITDMLTGMQQKQAKPSAEPTDLN